MSILKPEYQYLETAVLEQGQCDRCKKPLASNWSNLPKSCPVRGCGGVIRKVEATGGCDDECGMAEEDDR